MPRAGSVRRSVFLQSIGSPSGSKSRAAAVSAFSLGDRIRVSDLRHNIFWVDTKCFGQLHRRCRTRTTQIDRPHQQADRAIRVQACRRARLSTIVVPVATSDSTPPIGTSAARGCAGALAASKVSIIPMRGCSSPSGRRSPSFAAFNNRKSNASILSVHTVRQSPFRQQIPRWMPPARDTPEHAVCSLPRHNRQS